MTGIWYDGNDMILVVDRLKNESSGAYVSAGSVSVQIFDRDDFTVGSPISLAYAPGSNGKWTAVLPADLPVVLNNRYKATVTVNAGTQLRGSFDLDFVVRRKRL